MTLRTLQELPNGIRIVSDVMPEVETVSVGVWVGIGSRYETGNIMGISHLMEHMAFKGTKTRTAKEIAEAVENVGGYINAYTSRETTCFYIKVLKEDLKLALDILSDILQESVSDKEELLKEKQVILQEIMQNYDQPDEYVFDGFQATAFPDQPMGFSILGTPETLDKVSSKKLLDFVKENYTGKNMIVSACGNFDSKKFGKMVEDRFGDISAGKSQKPEKAVYKGGEFREKRKIEQVHLALGFPGVSVHDPLLYASSILSMILGGGMSSRLFQEIREKRGLVYSIYSFSSSYSDSGIWSVYAGTGEKEVAELIPVLTDELKKACKKIDAKELKRAKAQFKASILMGYESPSARAERNANQLLSFGRLMPRAEIVDKIDSLETSHILEAAKKIFTGKPTLAAVGPLKKLEGYDIVTHRLK